MKKISFLFAMGIFLCNAFTAQGEVYKTTNPDGSVSYTDSPTANSSKVIVTPSTAGSASKSPITTRTANTANAPSVEVNQPFANDVKPAQAPAPAKTSGSSSSKASTSSRGSSGSSAGGGSGTSAGGSATASGAAAKTSTPNTPAPKTTGATSGGSSKTTAGNTTTGNTTTGNTSNLLPELPLLNAGVSALRVNQLIDIILKDMLTEGEGIPETGPQRFAWAYKPTLAMGLNPTASGVPSWYPGTKFELWDQVLGWMTAYREKGAPHPVNSRIAVKDLYLYYFSKSKKSWVLLEYLPAIKEWSRGEGNTEDTNTRTWFRMREEPDGSTSFIVPPGSWFHTYGHLQRFNAADYGGLYFRFDFKLVTDDPARPNSLNKDRWVVQSGADYYPSAYPTVNLGAPYNPGVGTGRFLRAGVNWRTSTFLVLAPEYDLKKYPPNILGVYE